MIRTSTILLLFINLLSTQTVMGKLTPTHLRCEYLVNPLGIDVPRPRLSWQLSGDADKRGQRQTAYQIRAAGSRHALEQGKVDLWDSGKVSSDQTAQVDYA